MGFAFNFGTVVYFLALCLVVIFAAIPPLELFTLAFSYIFLAFWDPEKVLREVVVLRSPLTAVDEIWSKWSCPKSAFS